MTMTTLAFFDGLRQFLKLLRLFASGPGFLPGELSGFSPSKDAASASSSVAKWRGFSFQQTFKLSNGLIAVLNPSHLKTNLL